MSEEFIQLPIDGAGKRVATEQIQQGQFEVHLQKLIFASANGDPYPVASAAGQAAEVDGLGDVFVGVSDLRTAVIGMRDMVASASGQAAIVDGLEEVRLATQGLGAGLASATGQAAEVDGLEEIRQAVNAGEFARIKASNIRDTEEVRYDIPTVLISASIYTGIAPDGTDATGSGPALWTVIRTYFDASGKPSRERIKAGIKWDDRAVAGNWP